MSKLDIPTIKEIELSISNYKGFAHIARIPSYLPDEWGKDHRDYVIGCILPAMRLKPKVRRIANEAYLAGMERDSDGSSVVPDEWNWKDIPGVVHDYIFRLRRERRKDAYGHTWGLMEANAAYRDIWIAAGRPWRGWLWWTGLTAGSWVVWFRK